MYLFPRDAACVGADPELFFIPTNDYAEDLIPEHLKWAFYDEE